MNDLSFWKNKRVTVTGGAGFLGSYVVDKLEQLPVANIFIPRSKDCDLTKMSNCRKAVKEKDVVIHLAGIVGGIGYNAQNPATMFYDNLMMGVQLMEAARKAKVSKMVIIGTICSYPKHTPVPFKEADLWSGYPEETNAPYGLAKKMLLVQGQAYRNQYGLNSIYLLPTNLYGPRDNFNPQSSHVIAALIRKVAQAKKDQSPTVSIWGTGKSTREFLYVEDAADAIVMASEKYNESMPVNIGSGTEISIKSLATTIARMMNYEGKLTWDITKPDGQPRRNIDTSRAKEKFEFEAKTSLEDGLRKTIDWFLREYQDTLSD